ncbi:MAG TPA: hypothetical protein VIF15_15730 [Polyangiaceae bacterium]|jgi:hypothetical protein
MLGLFAGFWIFQWWKGAREARERYRTETDAKAEREQRDKDEREFRESATIGRARVLSAHQLGRVNLEPNIWLILEIESPDGAYQVELTQPIEPTELHRFGKGNMVDVYVDPKNREHVALCDPEIAAIHRDTEESMARADKLLRERE